MVGTKGEYLLRAGCLLTFGATSILSSLGKCGEHTLQPSECQLAGSRLTFRQP
jgi:hypothetical protein